jgi:hypothetical protein
LALGGALEDLLRELLDIVHDSFEGKEDDVLLAVCWVGMSICYLAHHVDDLTVHIEADLIYQHRLYK